MEAYDHYSSEGTPWGLSFPSHWQRSKLGRITSKIGSGATPKGGKTVYLDSGKVALIRSLNVHDEGFRYEDLAFIDDEAAAQLNSVSVLDNDVLLNITGASILRTTLAPRDVLPARVNQHVSILRPTDDVNPGYLHAWLASSQMHRYMYSQSVGSTREAITKAQLQGFPIMLPLKPEQDAIVAFLDAKTAEIDGVVEGLVRQRELLERYKRELIAHTVTKGLNPDAPMKESGLQWIGEIPEAWQIQTLKRLIKVSSGMEVMDEVQNGDSAVPVYGSGSGAFKYTSHNFSDSPAIIFGRKGTLGQPYIVEPPFWAVDTAYVATPTEYSDFGFIYYALLNFPWDPYVTKTAKPSLVATEILGAKVAAPEVGEQRKIAAFLDAKTAEIDGLITDLDRQVELLGRYRKQVINDVVTGKVRVSEEAA